MRSSATRNYGSKGSDTDSLPPFGVFPLQRGETGTICRGRFHGRPAFEPPGGRDRRGSAPREGARVLHVELATLGHQLGYLVADTRLTLVHVSDALSAAECVATINLLLGAADLRLTA